MGIVYAILRNGMWDDPAVANTGQIAKWFESVRVAGGYDTGRVAPYLTWRLCYLVCALLFGAARLAIGAPWVINDEGKHYEEFLERTLPSAIDVSNFDTLIRYLTYEEIALWILAVISYVFTLVSVFFALPAFALPYAMRSRRLLWCGWLVAFLPPFLTFLIYPLKSSVDWDEVTASVCQHAVTTIFEMHNSGPNLVQTLSIASDNGMMDPALAGVLTDRKSWCAHQGANWHETFYSSVVSCAWALEDQCIEVYCTRITISSDLVRCLSGCMDYANRRMGRRWLDKLNKRMERCLNRTESFQLAPPTSITSSGYMHTDMVAMYKNMLRAQRAVITDASVVVTKATTMAEYVVGTLIALVVGRYLIPSSISLLGGLTEALINLKAMFPGFQHGAWILILTTMEVVPVYAALLAMLQQLVGDGVFAVACVLGTCYASLGILTGRRLLKIMNGDEERERMYKLIWVEYALRALLVVGIATALIVWCSSQPDGLKKYIQEEILTPEVIATAIVDYVAKKIVTAVGGTDFVLSGFVQTEAWSAGMSSADKDILRVEVNEIHTLFNSCYLYDGLTDPDGAPLRQISLSPTRASSMSPTRASSIPSLSTMKSAGTTPSMGVVSKARTVSKSRTVGRTVTDTE